VPTRDRIVDRGARPERLSTHSGRARFSWTVTESISLIEGDSRLLGREQFLELAVEIG